MLAAPKTVTGRTFQKECSTQAYGLAHLLRELLRQPADLLLPWQQLLADQVAAQAALLVLPWLLLLLVVLVLVMVAIQQ